VAGEYKKIRRFIASRERQIQLKIQGCWQAGTVRGAIEDKARVENLGELTINKT
jgi:hypothetical protein